MKSWRLHNHEQSFQGGKDEHFCSLDMKIFLRTADLVLHCISNSLEVNHDWEGQICWGAIFPKFETF